MLGLLWFRCQTITREVFIQSFDITVAYRNLTVESRLFNAPFLRARHAIDRGQAAEDWSYNLADLDSLMLAL